MGNITRGLSQFISILSIFSPFPQEVTLNIRNGAIRGSRLSTLDQHKPYYSFRGIRFAEPPVGDLRFRAPVPAGNWTGVLDATSDGNVCIQDTLEGSEDCLFINVYTPTLPVENALNNTKLPVMVWFYGGMFIRGGSNYERYSPDFFLDENVIFVSFNYRTGVFGYLSTSDQAAPGNWGLKDQLLALAWVQDNIEYFGGNKSDVTVFGESAGAASISILMQNPAAENLFHKVILESGVSLNIWALSIRPRDCAFALGTFFEVTSRNSTELVERLRTIDARRLMSRSLEIDVVETYWTNPLNGLVYAPCKELDDLVVGENYEYLRNGSFTRVPVIVGFNSQEGLVNNAVVDFLMPYLSSYVVNPARLVPIDLNLDNDTIRSHLAREIKNRYFPTIHRQSLNKNLSQFITDDQFVRPINEAARLMSKYVPVYHYRFSYVKNVTAEDLDEKGEGAHHTAELNYLFASDVDLHRTDSDYLLRRRLVRLWTNFVKTGNPTPQEDELFDRLTWTTYDQGQFLDMGHTLRMSSDLRKYSVDWWRNIFTANAIHPLNSY